MVITEVIPQRIPEILVVRYRQFADFRGHFVETLRTAPFAQNGGHPLLQGTTLQGAQFVQVNESYSVAKTFRGLHFQHPYQGKLVRVISGHLIDFAVDIRPNSPTFGQLLAYEMPERLGHDFAEWIWIPAGFAHGIYMREKSVIEYFCTAVWNPQGEVTLSPMTRGLQFDYCDPSLKQIFLDALADPETKLKDRDRDGLQLKEWLEHPLAAHFAYERWK
jgi:dTDP-4-dehydrorhamnose 3,5-epimerase